MLMLDLRTFDCEVFGRCVPSVKYRVVTVVQVCVSKYSLIDVNVNLTCVPVHRYYVLCTPGYVLHTST